MFEIAKPEYQPHVKLWKNATGAIPIADRYVAFGLAGSADLTGILCGRRFDVEIKTGNARQNEKQKFFQKMIEKYGGIYIVARSIADVLERIKEEAAKDCPKP